MSKGGRQEKAASGHPSRRRNTPFCCRPPLRGSRRSRRPQRSLNIRVARNTRRCATVHKQARGCTERPLLARPYQRYHHATRLRISIYHRSRFALRCRPAHPFSSAESPSPTPPGLTLHLPPTIRHSPPLPSPFQSAFCVSRRLRAARRAAPNWPPGAPLISLRATSCPLPLDPAWLAQCIGPEPWLC